MPDLYSWIGFAFVWGSTLIVALCVLDWWLGRVVHYVGAWSMLLEFVGARAEFRRWRVERLRRKDLN